MLETVREYALERLTQRGEAAAARRRHADHFLALADATGTDTAGFDRLEREHDNLRAALRWYLHADEGERALRLGCRLWTFWAVCGHYAAGAPADGLPAARQGCQPRYAARGGTDS
jgi:predicted ATPase